MLRLFSMKKYPTLNYLRLHIFDFKKLKNTLEWKKSLWREFIRNIEGSALNQRSQKCSRFQVIFRFCRHDNTSNKKKKPRRKSTRHPENGATRNNVDYESGDCVVSEWGPWTNWWVLSAILMFFLFVEWFLKCSNWRIESKMFFYSNFSHSTKTCGLGDKFRQRTIEKQPKDGFFCPPLKERSWCGSSRCKPTLINENISNSSYFKWS